MREIFEIPIINPEMGLIFEWMVVLTIILNIVALIAYIWAYIEFKVHPPLPKFQLRNARECLKYFGGFKNEIINVAVTTDIIIIVLYALLIASRFIHLIIFE